MQQPKDTNAVPQKSDLISTVMWWSQLSPAQQRLLQFLGAFPGWHLEQEIHQTRLLEDGDILAVPALIRMGLVEWNDIMRAMVILPKGNRLLTEDTMPYSHEPDKARLEAMARLICAHKMRLRRDPVGMDLPDEIWRQALPRAQAVMTLVSDDAAL